MATCGGILEGLTNVFECCKTDAKGLRGRVWIFNHDDLDKDATVFDETNKNVITELALKSDDITGFVFDGKDNINEATVDINVGTYVNTFLHSVVLRILHKTEDAKRFINEASCATVFIVVENREVSGNVIYEGYGWDSGLILTALTQSTAYDDDIFAEITFSGDDTHTESTEPKTINYGTAAETRDALDSLLSEREAGG